MKFIVFTTGRPGAFTQADSEAEAVTAAEQFAADNPGETFGVYSLVSTSHAEPPAKVRPPVVTKDAAALAAEEEPKP